jgi:hypothetical protein
VGLGPVVRLAPPFDATRLFPACFARDASSRGLFCKDNDPQAIASQQNFHTFTAMLVWAF